MGNVRKIRFMCVHWVVIAGALMLSLAAAQSPCGSCPPKSYCVTGSSNVCAACNQACKSCTSLGPQGCTECSDGYHWENGICVLCPAGTFGSGCNGTCHCLEPGACNATNGQCSGKCEKGYYLPPACVTECPNGSFGLDCLEKCHCLNDSVCEKALGFCPGGMCHPDWVSYGCSQRLPKLIDPPKVRNATCDYLTVEWRRWSAEIDIGDLPIKEYRLYKILDSVNPNITWIYVTTVQENVNVTNYVVNVTGLVRDASYKFRVDVHYSDNGKVVEKTSMGASSVSAIVPCTTTTTQAPVTIPIIVGTDIFTAMAYTNQPDGSLIVTWTMDPSLDRFLWNVSLTYQMTGIGDCSPVTGSPTTSINIDQKNTSFRLASPGSWRKYLFTLHAQGTGVISAVNGSKSVEAVSAEVAPNASVSGIQTTALSKDSATLQWVSVPCANRGGTLLHYTVNLNTSGSLLHNTTTTTSFTFSGLTPFTRYQASVRYVNRVGAGPESDVFTFTTLEGVPGTIQVKELVPSETNITVIFDPPVPANGIILEYQISYSSNVTFVSPESLTINATSSEPAVIRRLTPYTVYYVKVRASTSAGAGPYSTVQQVRTLQARPFPPSTIRQNYQNNTCLGVTWVAPDQTTVAITGYTLTIVKSSIVVVTENIPPNETKYLRCGLDPGTAYTVSMVSNSGTGSGEAIERTFYTEQGIPKQPSPPRLVSINTTSAVIEIEPVTLTEGPLTGYQIEVEEIQVSGRKKRVADVPGYVTAELSPQNVTEQRRFEIGDGQKYGGYVNKPLLPGQGYQVHYVVLSELNNVTKYSVSKLPQPFTTLTIQSPTTQAQLPVADSSLDIGVVIGIIVGIILLIILIICIILIVLWRRKHRNGFKPSYLELDKPSSKPAPPKQKDEYDPEKYWNQISSVRQSRYITYGRECLPDNQIPFSGIEPSVPASSRVTFFKEFKTLPHKSDQATMLQAQKFPDRNRFPHLLPCDQSLVPLRPDGHSMCPYINASFVSGYKRSNAYIAAQSPFDDRTAVDFWRLIQQWGVTTVVMVTNIVEDNIVKCTQFWPQSGKATIGGFQLELIDEDVYSDFTIRVVSVDDTTTRTGYKVRLYEFTSWPDHGVPDDPIPFLDMRYKVYRSHADDRSPILVHCGTGVARTGVFIAVDSLIEQYAAEGRISVYAFVRKMRRERPHMVRTFKQYVFIYECLLEYFQAGHTMADVTTLKKMYHDWTQTNSKTGRSFLFDQFHLLQSLTRGPTPAQCAAACQPQNVHKNRYPDVVPPDASRPDLTTPTKLSDTDYINAVFIDGYRQRRRFIVTQTPLHTTILDFWRMVYDHHVQTIVMMENFGDEANNQGEYWPSDSIKQWEPFFVETTAAYQQENVTIRNFKLMSTLRPKDKPRYIRQFQFNAWAKTNLIPVSKTMVLDLLQLVLEYQKMTNFPDSPIVVHCQDGATHSGLFVALSLVVERIEEDQEVDVYHVVKHVKRRRPQVLADYDQYRFCYKTLWDYMNLRMIGGTFTDTLGQTKADKTYGVASLSLTSQPDSLY